MKEDNNIQETIDNYLSGLLSEKEKTAFEDQITNNSNLSSMVDEAKLINEAIYLASLSSLKEKVGKDIKNIKYKSSPNTGKLLLGAALLVGSATATYFITTKTESSRVVEKNHTEQPSNQPNNPTIATATEMLEEIKEEEKQTTIKEPIETVESLKKNNPIVETTVAKQTDELPKTTSVQPLEPTKQPNKEQKTTPEPETVVLKEQSPTSTSSETPKVLPVVCDKEYVIKTAPSCKETNTGTITINSKAKKPLQLELDEAKTTGSGVFKGVEVGKHTILITYNNECLFTEVITVNEKWCPLNNSYSFNPDYGEKWQLIYEEGSDGIFTIFNTFGKEIYQHQFGSGDIYWNGVDSQGVVSPIGTYVVTINYSDGRKEKVELTIVR